MSASPPTTATIAGLVRDRAQRSPDDVAVRRKRLGIWQEVTWGRCWRDVQRTAAVLLHLGVAPGDRVAIVSDNRYEWLLADVATVAVRGATVGVDPTAEPERVHDALAATGPRVVVAENGEQVDKVLAVADRLPDMEHIVHVDDRGVRAGDSRQRSWRDALDQHATAGGDDAVRQRMEAGEPADVVTVVPAGNAPRITAHEVMGSIDALLVGGVQPPPSDADLLLPLTSFADPTARAFGIWLCVAAGARLHFAESVATVRQDLREVQPTLLFAPSQVWERLAADIAQRLAGASRLKRWTWRMWRPGDGGAGAATARVSSALGHLVVHRALRDRVGLRHARHAAYHGTVRPDVLAFFAGIGVPLSPVGDQRAANGGGGGPPSRGADEPEARWNG